MSGKQVPVIPDGMQEMYDNWHIAPAMRAGDFVFCSGVLGTGADGRALADPAEQFDAVFQNLRHVLAAAGADLSHVVEMVTFHLDLQADIAALGAVLLGSGLAGVLIAISMGPEWGWTASGTAVSLILGVVSLAAWFVSARLVREPIIDLKILLRRSVAFTTLSSGFCWALVAAFSVLVPMMVMTPDDLGLDYGFGLGFVGYAMVQVPVGIAMLLGGYTVGRLVQRRMTSRGVMILGMLPASAGCLLMAFLHHDMTLVVAFAALVGLGCGIGYAATPNLLIESVPPQIQATAGGIASTSGNLFPAVLPVLVFAVLNNSHTAKAVDDTTYYSGTGITIAFVICGVAGILGLLTALPLPRRTPGAAGELVHPDGAAPAVR